MNKTIRLTTSQALVQFIHQQYIEVDGIQTPFVEGVFNIFGHGNVLGIGQALEENPGNLHIYQGKNEQGMALSAVAFAKQSLRQKIYAVTSSVGPGSANLVTAAGTALANNIPVLLLPGDTFATRQPDPVLQQLEHNHSAAITTNDALKPVSRYWDRITRPEQIMSSLIRAFETLTNPETAGPATICISQDVAGEAFDYPEEFFIKRVHYLDRPKATKRSLEALTTAIKKSKRPVILVGGGAKYSEAREELIYLSKTHHIPIVETQAGKSTVESTFPNNLGGLGVTGNLAANKIVTSADLVIGVGTRYTDFTTGSKGLFNYDTTTFANINISRAQAYKLDALQVVGDAKAVLGQLVETLVGYQTSYGEDIKKIKNEWLTERDRLKQIEFNRNNFTPEIAGHFSQNHLNKYADLFNSQLTQTNVLIAINELIDQESIIVGAAGSLPGDLQRVWESTIPNTYHLEYGYSCMGYEIAGALGTKLAKPEKESYAMVGDGSFLMLHTELVTALQYDKKINILLFDNSGYGCINNLQMSNGSGSFFTELINHETKEIMTVDYATVGQGYGLKTYKVTTKDELIFAIEDAKKQTVSTLIDIKVLPKTMTDGYDAWWHVGVAEESQNLTINKAYESKEINLKGAKQY